MKKVYTFTTVVFLILMTFNTLTVFGQNPNEWILSKNQSGIKAYHKIVNCSDKQVVFLKFENTQQATVEVKWTEIYQFEGSSDTHQKPFTFNLFIEPGILAAASCEEVPVLQLVSIPPPTDKIQEVSKFSFDNFSISSK